MMTYSLEKAEPTALRFTSKTPEAQQCVEAQSATEPPPPPRPQPFKVKRKRPSAPFQEPIMLDTNVIPTIEMSEVPTQMSSPTMQPTSAHLLSPIPISSTLHRALDPIFRLARAMVCS